MWRQNASADLYSDSDSSVSSDGPDSDSDSSSSSEKQARNTLKAPVSNGKITGKPGDKPPVGAVGGVSSQNGAGNPRPPSGKPPSGSNRNNCNGIGQTRNFTSLLSRRKENGKLTPILPRRQENSPSYSEPESSSKKVENASTTKLLRKKPQIEATLTIQRKPQQSPGSHPVKPRSNSVNQATPEKVHSSKTGGFRAVIDRVRSAKPPRMVYQHRTPPKPSYDARILSYNACISSSSDDDDEDDRDDLDDDSSSDDSR